ncbi:MAG: DUF6152 family protein [bacterium]
MAARPQPLALAAIGMILITVSTLSAHHRWPVNRSAEVTVQGTVASYTWGNPHVMIVLDVRADDGSIERWEVGGPSTNRMARNGWDRNTLKAGDTITGIGYRFSDGSRILRLERIVTSAGRELFLYGRR